MTTTALLTIVVTDDAGATASVDIQRHVKLAQLLRRGLAALYGEPGPRPDEYDLLIGGTIQDVLERSVEEAGLSSGAEVAILRKEISRG